MLDVEVRALLDACVLVPMPLCDTLLRLSEAGFYRALWSEPILLEVGDALEVKLKLSRRQRDRRIELMRLAFPEATVPVSEKLADQIDCLPDRNDRHVLAAAFGARADLIVSQNVRHFPVECLERYGLLCETPDEFLKRQFRRSPRLLMEVLAAQAQAVKTNVSAITAKLKPMVPEFVGLMDEYKGE